MNIGTNIVRGKIWGNTRTLFCKSNVEIARIEVSSGGYCSKHIHEHKYNLFFIETGELEVTIYRHDAGTIIEDITVLKRGDSTYVEPGVFHKFKANTNTVAYEIYWVELDNNDIVRENVGGKKETKL